jgi:hypothetical protein
MRSADERGSDEDKLVLNREEHELGRCSVSKRSTSPRFPKENVSSHCPCPRFSHPSGAASAKRRNCRAFDEHEVRLGDDWVAVHIAGKSCVLSFRRRAEAESKPQTHRIRLRFTELPLAAKAQVHLSIH